MEKQYLKKNNFKDDDVLIGLKSSGLHSNGYSLIRELLRRKKINLNRKLGAISLGKILLEPTKIYVKEIQTISKKVNIKAMAHITGGGLLGNLARILNNKYSFLLERKSLFSFNKKLFSYLMKQANLTEKDMLKTFNCGYGMVLVVDRDDAKEVFKSLKKLKQKFKIIGKVKKASDKSEMLII